jgi:hypothetical protein
MVLDQARQRGESDGSDRSDGSDGSDGSRPGLENLELQCIVLDRASGKLTSLVRACKDGENRGDGELEVDQRGMWVRGRECAYGGFLNSLLTQACSCVELDLLLEWPSVQRPAIGSGLRFQFLLRETFHIDLFPFEEKEDAVVNKRASWLRFLCGAWTKLPGNFGDCDGHKKECPWGTAIHWGDKIILMDA